MLTWEVEGDSGQPELVEAARIRRRAVALLLGRPHGRGRRAVAVLLGVRARPGPRSRRGRRRRSSWAPRLVVGRPAATCFAGRGARGWRRRGAGAGVARDGRGSGEGEGRRYRAKGRVSSYRGGNVSNGPPSRGAP